MQKIYINANDVGCPTLIWPHVFFSQAIIQTEHGKYASILHLEMLNVIIYIYTYIHIQTHVYITRVWACVGYEEPPLF